MIPPFLVTHYVYHVCLRKYQSVHSFGAVQRAGVGGQRANCVSVIMACTDLDTITANASATIQMPVSVYLSLPLPRSFALSVGSANAAIIAVTVKLCYAGNVADGALSVSPRSVKVTYQSGPICALLMIHEGPTWRRVGSQCASYRAIVMMQALTIHRQPSSVTLVVHVRMRCVDCTSIPFMWPIRFAMDIRTRSVLPTMVHTSLVTHMVDMTNPLDVPCVSAVVANVSYFQGTKALQCVDTCVSAITRIQCG